MAEIGLLRSGQLHALALANSTNNNNDRVKNPIAIKPNDRWCSEDIPNQWYQVVFLNGYAYIDRYLFQRNVTNNPESWYVEGYTLNSEWVTISSGNYDDFSDCLFKYYQIDNNGPFTSIRLHSTGKSIPEKNYFFCINMLEFYGKLILYQTLYCQKQKFFSILFSYILYL